MTVTTDHILNSKELANVVEKVETTLTRNARTEAQIIESLRAKALWQIAVQLARIADALDRS